MICLLLALINARGTWCHILSLTVEAAVVNHSMQEHITTSLLHLSLFESVHDGSNHDSVVRSNPFLNVQMFSDFLCKIYVEMKFLVCVIPQLTLALRPSSH